MREEARIFSETGPILGESGETMARYKAHGERFAIEQGRQNVSLEREVLLDRTQVRENLQRSAGEIHVNHVSRFMP
jgi:hypothetical protein